MDDWDELIEEPIEAVAGAEYPEDDFVTWVRGVIDGRDLARVDIIKAAHLNLTFGYQILSGTRKASRDKLVQLSFGMGLDIDEASHMLELRGFARLRPDRRRDAVIGWHLAHGRPLAECDDLLWRLGEDTVVAR